MKRRYLSLFQEAKKSERMQFSSSVRPLFIDFPAQFIHFVRRLLFSLIIDFLKFPFLQVVDLTYSLRKLVIDAFGGRPPRFLSGTLCFQWVWTQIFCIFAEIITFLQKFSLKNFRIFKILLWNLARFLWVDLREGCQRTWWTAEERDSLCRQSPRHQVLDSGK